PPRPPGAPAPTTTATTTAAAPPPPPAVAPADLEGLLPSLNDVRNIAGDQNLKGDDPVRQLAPLNSKDAGYDPPDCAVTVAVGVGEVYTVQPVQGIFMTGYFDLQNAGNPRGSVQSVAALADAAAARTQLTNLQSTWARCAGAGLKLTYPDTHRTVGFAVDPPADSGGGVVTMEVRTQGQPVRFVLAMAAKDNVFVEVRASATASERAHRAALDVVNYVLGKIPG
ncbi:sensor domain-containing protein, partial [Mycobacterium sp. E1319]|uniref:sensor domain-containing protein n=2 Tax=unclassified Mycobacterium TaxID=2642494 RepID=UPI000AFCA2D8